MSKNPRSAARRALSLAALSGLGLAAAPAAHAAAGLGATQLYPLAHTPLDLLSNNLHVPVGGMDLSTFGVTAPFHDGLPLREVPVVGPLTH
ncbi:hypothetical protein Caci_0796 [Catenulispora acidiphila DSM 44928]|uniref:Secreted protein n=1 Tax=Catenulispora acidiphila (strain DSM 44928 / JCM 14897 / NBRC 102108 / NRRL B-24433 / ID139908) TaxID=479433 RepID=C7Q0V3_CATAD|nr:hypothetical protein [Catenulispora acidiphila]ACU69731.1 hypothetical protein Caci_0796 [Catenulispora acidiphila DSM 44928]